MVPNIMRDASTNRNMAVLCQELFELPDVTLTSSLYHSASPVWLLDFCQATLMSQTNSFILWFTSLSWIRPDLRANLRFGCQACNTQAGFSISTTKPAR